MPYFSWTRMSFLVGAAAIWKITWQHKGGGWAKRQINLVVNFFIGLRPKNAGRCCFRVRFLLRVEHLFTLWLVCVFFFGGQTQNKNSPTEKKTFMARPRPERKPTLIGSDCWGKWNIRASSGKIGINKKVVSWPWIRLFGISGCGCTTRGDLYLRGNCVKKIWKTPPHRNWTRLHWGPGTATIQ